MQNLEDTKTPEGEPADLDASATGGRSDEIAEQAQKLFRHCDLSDPIIARLFDAYVNRLDRLAASDTPR